MYGKQAMKALLDKFHARLGDLWWYSLMIFIACRSGDVIQAFIGLWLVPKYVGPNELGAVLPLQQLSGLFAVPLAIIATVFAKYVNIYATRGEYGKVKCFIRDVLLASIIVFLGCIVVAYLVIPHFYERLNISTGFLTLLILAAGFTGNIANLFTSALQGLKKFKTMTIQNMISAPIRLVTLLVAMPIRALSGYTLGQATPPATCSLLAAYSLHRDLKTITPDTSWRKDIPKILRYLWPIAIYTAFGALWSAITMTIYRQRLPELESSAYYMLSRFAETAGYIGTSVAIVLTPLVSESYEQGKCPIRILNQSLWGIAIGGIAFTSIFYALADNIFSCSGNWRLYSDFADLLPLMTINISLGAAIGTCCSYEMACRRFKSLFGIVIMNALWVSFLITFTGYEYFRGCLPNPIIDWMASLNIASLKTLTIIGIPFGLLQFAFIYAFIRRHSDTNMTKC